jgi:DNA-binding HxlR family transcriptional regulator
MLSSNYAKEEAECKVAVGVSAECFGGDIGRPLVVADLESYEGIATNILADRLRKLVAHGIITTERDRSDGRKLIYLLTAKGIDLAPVLTEMVLWAAGHEDTGNQALVRLMQKDKEKFLAEVRQRWAEKRIRSTAEQVRTERLRI